MRQSPSAHPSYLHNLSKLRSLFPFLDSFFSEGVGEKLQNEHAFCLSKEIGQQAVAELLAELVHLNETIGQHIFGARVMW